MRYLSKSIQSDLNKKTILLSGPRQVGKTTLSKSLVKNTEYRSWDINKDKKVILGQAWNKQVNLVVLDEIHKLKNWKNFIKGIIDETNNSPPLLLTGSAKLGLMTKDGDALTGRTYHYRLHPLDIWEIKNYFPEIESKNLLEHLLKHGNFPEAFFNPKDAERLKQDRLSQVLKDDLFTLKTRVDLRSTELLLQLIRERVGGTINFSNLAQDLSISPITVKNWIQDLQDLYLIFVLHPYSKNLARSIRKEPKVYFYDCSMGYEEAACLENLVACYLLKFVELKKDTLGEEYQLKYFRDRDDHEVDFILTKNSKPYLAIEVKTNEDRPTKSLKYLQKKIPNIECIQLVKNLQRKSDYQGIAVVPLEGFLSKTVDEQYASLFDK